ncbi:MAG: AMP-binding protein [Cyanobacteria bacterium J06627_32]
MSVSVFLKTPAIDGHQTSKRELDSEKTAITFLAANQVASCPAVIKTQGKIVSYAQLWQSTVKIAGQLRQLGICKNDTVAIVMPNGPEMAISFLAVAAVATAAPLNPAYQTPEFDFYLSDLEAKALIVPQGSASQAMEVAQQYNILVLKLGESSSGEPSLFRDGCEVGSSVEESIDWATEEDVALVLHTSGTTARPKMVPLSHRNLWMSARNVAEVLSLSSSDRCLNIMPLFHIHGLVACLLASLSVGGSIVCTSDLRANQFLFWLADLQPSWYSAVPTMHQAILEQAKKALPNGRHSLRFIRSSSAALSPSVMESLKSTFDVPILEAYGMTEAAHQMTSNRISAVQKPGSVGQPAGPEVAIMDSHSALLPAGQLGEVVIKGENITRGYANNRQANQSAFVDGWFRTGDRGYFDKDGYLFLNGRLKEVINRGGENISPQTVDDVLMQLPEIKQAVTFAVPHPTLGEDIAAAVVLHSRTRIEMGGKVEERRLVAQIRQHLFEQLAGFKVPSQIVLVESIPKGPTGKLQRIGLAKQLAQQMSVIKASPRYGLEAVISTCFKTGLKVEEASIYDNFFLLGGDSLTGIETITDINRRFGLDLSPPLIFEKPTISELTPAIFEALLAQHPDLAGVKVSLGEDDSGDVLLVAFGVPSGEKQIDTDELDAFVCDRLQEIDVPYRFITAETESAYVAPRIELERRLSEAVEKAFGSVFHNPLSVESDFMRYATNRGSISKVLSAIETVCGKAVSEKTLEKTPTVAQLAQVLLPSLLEQQQLWELGWNPIEPVIPSAASYAQPVDVSQLPVFVLNGGFYGLIAGAYHMAHQIGQTRPCYSIHSRGLDGEALPHTCIEDMATEAIEGIRELQPHGPYFLVGLCTGGTIAYEIALQLKAAGEEIALLGLVHTLAPKLSGESRKGFASKGAAANKKNEKLAKVPQSVVDGWLKDMPDNPHILAVAKGLYQAHLSYRAKPYEGRIVLFQPERGDTRQARKWKKVWSRLALGGLTRYTCQGDDKTMYSTVHLRSLSIQLQKCINKASERW